MKILMIGAAVLTTALTAASSGAVAAEARASARGLELNRQADARSMLRRLDAAALNACGGSPASVPETRRETRRSDCYRTAMDVAVHSLGAPLVSSLYQNTGRALAAR